MIATVLIRLEGPMQSWGNSPRGVYRDSRPRPTKSGVIGLVANIMGRDYTDSIDDLAALDFAVRIDRAGSMDIDYHTTGSGSFPLLPGDVFADPKLRRAAARKDPRDPDFPFVYTGMKAITRTPDGELVGTPANTDITIDRYLSDAAFLVALTGDLAMAANIHAALLEPARTPYLGRRAYMPSAPLHVGVRPGAGEDPFAVLRQEPRLERADGGPLTAWAQVQPGSAGSVVAHDQPVSYAEPRRWSARAELRERVNPPAVPAASPETNYDFFEEM